MSWHVWCWAPLLNRRAPEMCLVMAFHSLYLCITAELQPASIQVFSWGLQAPALIEWLLRNISDCIQKRGFHLRGYKMHQSSSPWQCGHLVVTYAVFGLWDEWCIVIIKKKNTKMTILWHKKSSLPSFVIVKFSLLNTGLITLGRVLHGSGGDVLRGWRRHWRGWSLISMKMQKCAHQKQEENNLKIWTSTYLAFLVTWAVKASGGEIIKDNN